MAKGNHIKVSGNSYIFKRNITQEEYKNFKNFKGSEKFYFKKYYDKLNDKIKFKFYVKNNGGNGTPSSKDLVMKKYS